jgi:deoxyribodipyrimidine photo-lyase
VFTAYWRKASSEIEQLPSPQPAPKRIDGPYTWPSSESLASLKLQPAIRWDAGLAAHWTPGETGALKLLKSFGTHLARYPELRDRPDTSGTSRLSPHLHFGELGPRQILAALARHRAVAATSRAYETYSRQLGWREFAHHLLFHFPDTPQEPLDKRFAALAWKRDKKALGAWQRGHTGYPIVDAGLRELWQTGWMHNRVRLIVASFLTKNLQMHWVAGARWFWDTLVDADLANNTLGWQWTAGCGADAAPYYRIFNPILQTERFDPNRSYLRKWLPEIAALPSQWIHQPWNTPSEILTKAGIVLGKTYPQPLVDLVTSRNAALAAYDKIRR